MPVTPRADLADLPAFVPGRKLPGAVNLASNEVAYPPPDHVVDAITQAATGANRYPNPDSALIDRLAMCLDVDAGEVVVGNGSVSLCAQLIQAMCGPGHTVLFAWRSFEAYPVLTRAAGARPRTVALTQDHRHDLDATLAAIDDTTRLVFVSNPHNPTGTALRMQELVRFLEAVPGDVLVVLDEAYREFVTDPEVPDGLVLARSFDNVAVLRTFSKAYRLAGARIGYCVAPEPVAAALRKVYVPFSVNVLAQAAALAALDVRHELLARCAEVAAERERVRTRLLQAGYAPPPSQGNYLWLDLGERTGAFDRHCMDRRIVIRAFDGEGVRVSIGTPRENDAFLAAARSFPLAPVG
jgi:histidinol-phosphate aminotransferase